MVATPVISCKSLYKVFGLDTTVLERGGLDIEQMIESNPALVPAVRDVTLDVSKGEILVVMGLSGSGKSTLVRCLSRLHESSSGEILIEGENILEMSEKELIELRRNKMGMVFQHFALLPHLSVLQNVAFPLTIQGQSKSQAETRAQEVVDLVGPDVTRFVMLTRKNDAPLDFDFSKVLEQSRDNPVFYVQYASARIHSVLRKAGDAGIVVDDATLAAADLGLLTHEAELDVVKKLAEWPRLIEIAARTNEPHRVAFYLYELAGAFHALWNRGNDLPELRFLQEGDSLATQAKIALIRSVSIVISAGLGILGVTPAKEMR